MNAAVITAKGTTESMPEKNMTAIGGKPIVSYPIRAAVGAKSIDSTYVYTDGERIGKVALDLGAKWLHRPRHMAVADNSHEDAIIHAAELICEDTDDEADILVILLGNTVHISSADIDRCVLRLKEDENLTGVLTAWKAQDDHPLRAMTTNCNGHLVPYPDILRVSPNTNRQNYPPVYYYDQGVWAVRMPWVAAGLGPDPWTWMGPRCGLEVRPWVTGRDIHDEFDIEVSEWWVNR